MTALIIPLLPCFRNLSIPPTTNDGVVTASSSAYDPSPKCHHIVFVNYFSYQQLQIGFQGSRLRYTQSSAGRAFIRQCSWDQHLRKGKEGSRIGQREKLSCSNVEQKQTYPSIIGCEVPPVKGCDLGGGAFLQLTAEYVY